MPRTWLDRVALLALLTAGVWALADSHVRIVRISFLAHRVEVLRLPDTADAGAPLAPRWSTALLNAPVVENEKIRTGADGQAEIQLECGSALRLAPNSELTVSVLRLRDDGVRATTVALTAGEAYFSVRRADSPDFHLGVGAGTVAAPEGAASLRVTASEDGPATVELLDGHAQVQDGKQLIVLRKAAALQLRP
ncbi:MAG: FecR family protein, partial [Streptosporangiaceae bacterium]